MKQLLQNVLIAFLGAYAMFLYFTEKLLFLVHPRNVVIVLVAGGFCFFIGSIGIIFSVFKIYRKKKRRVVPQESRDNPIRFNKQSRAFVVTNFEKSFLLRIRFMVGSRTSQVFFCLLIVCVVLLLYKPQPLTSVLASQRSSDITLDSGIQKSTTIFESFTIDTMQYSLKDWYLFSNSNSDITFLNQKRAKVSGFLFKDANDPTKLLIARFFVSCCAIDARPVGLFLDPKDFEKYSQDTWLEIEGDVEVKRIGETQQIFLKPTSITKLDKPSNPYLY